MSRIISCSSQVDICVWVRTNKDQIEGHRAWKGNVNAEQAEALLEGRDSFTYLLRKGEGENAYLITFVKEDASIKHQGFTLEFDRKGWYYKNGSYCNSPTEIVSESLEELIPQMMHCTDKECIIHQG